MILHAGDCHSAGGDLGVPPNRCLVIIFHCGSAMMKGVTTNLWGVPLTELVLAAAENH